MRLVVSSLVVLRESEVHTLSGTPESLVLRGREARVYGSEENVSEFAGHPSAVHRGDQE